MFIYLHGFNSAYDPENEKVQALQSLGEVVGITYDTYNTFEGIFEEIRSQLPSDLEDAVFVGTSLGGFWAATVAKFFGRPSVIINPCHNPSVMLQKYVGKVITNYYTSATDVLASEAVKTYAGHQLFGLDESFEILPLVLLDMGDEVIDSWETRETLAGFPMVHFAEGNHRFAHMQDSLDEIRQYMNHCSYVSDLNV